MKKLLPAIWITLLLIGVTTLWAGDIPTLSSLDIRTNGQLKKLRKDVQRSIAVVKGHRAPENLPALKFYRYKVTSRDTFWTILSRSGLDMDTLMTVNDLFSPGQIKAGMTIFIPNMRGVVERTEAGKKRRHTIPQIYIDKVNGPTPGKYRFIPCGKISRLERSLFMGTAFLFPLSKGRRTSGFGARRDPFHKQRLQFHKGIDLACPIGSPVYAARRGTVTFTGFNGGYGKLVVLKHEHGYSTYYGHLSHFTVKRGQKVKAGDMIARSGNTGRSTGPHLHFEVRRGKRAVNPGHLVKRR